MPLRKRYLRPMVISLRSSRSVIPPPATSRSISRALTLSYTLTALSGHYKRGRDTPAPANASLIRSPKIRRPTSGSFCDMVVESTMNIVCQAENADIKRILYTSHKLHCRCGQSNHTLGSNDWNPITTEKTRPKCILGLYVSEDRSGKRCLAVIRGA